MIRSQYIFIFETTLVRTLLLVFTQATLKKRPFTISFTHWTALKKRHWIQIKVCNTWAGPKSRSSFSFLATSAGFSSAGTRSKIETSDSKKELCATKCWASFLRRDHSVGNWSSASSSSYARSKCKARTRKLNSCWCCSYKGPRRCLYTSSSRQFGRRAGRLNVKSNEELTVYKESWISSVRYLVEITESQILLEELLMDFWQFPSFTRKKEAEWDAKKQILKIPYFLTWYPKNVIGPFEHRIYHLDTKK